MRLKAIKCKRNFYIIFSEISRNLCNETLGLLPLMKSTRDFSTRSRNKQGSFYGILLHEIPLYLQKTNNDKQFMQFDSGVGSEKIFAVFLF